MQLVSFTIEAMQEDGKTARMGMAEGEIFYYLGYKRISEDKMKAIADILFDTDTSVPEKKIDDFDAIFIA